jgi:hypothetical protein
LFVALWVQLVCHAQGRGQAASPFAARGSVSAVDIPFVGCRSDTQAEPLETPKGTAASVAVSGAAAKLLAYYGSALDLGVIAPRGWYCLAVNGSGGSFLFVSSQPIDAPRVFAPEFRGFEGPAIEVSDRLSDQNGDRLDKAQIIARVFPAYRSYAKALLVGFDVPNDSYQFGPYPLDRLTYKSKNVVEYTTPPQREGLGTHSSLKKSAHPIEGVAILSGEPPDVILLSVRLPHGLTGLAPEIVSQVEREFNVSLPRSRGRNAPPIRGE